MNASLFARLKRICIVFVQVDVAAHVARAEQGEDAQVQAGEELLGRLHRRPHRSGKGQEGQATGETTELLF